MDYVNNKNNWCSGCREAGVPPVAEKLVRAAVASGAGCPEGWCPVCWYRYGRAVPSEPKKGGRK